MKRITSNPWGSIPAAPPFILPEDGPFVTAFNRTATPLHRIDLRLLPEPFFGAFDAPVAVLLQNPGLGPLDLRHHRNPTFAAALRKSLSKRANRTHFHLLDPTHGSGYHWWRKTRKELIADLGILAVGESVLALGFAP